MSGTINPENTFFQMVNLHYDIVNSINFIDAKHYSEVSGRKCFEKLQEQLEETHERLKTSTLYMELNYKEKSLNEQLDILWGKFYRNYENSLGHYFRNLYRIVKYIEETNLIDDFEEKSIYRYY